MALASLVCEKRERGEVEKKGGRKRQNTDKGWFCTSQRFSTSVQLLQLSSKVRFEQLEDCSTLAPLLVLGFDIVGAGLHGGRVGAVPEFELVQKGDRLGKTAGQFPQLVALGVQRGCCGGGTWLFGFSLII